jgi:hypothetical protein
VVYDPGKASSGKEKKTPYRFISEEFLPEKKT